MEEHQRRGKWWRKQTKVDIIDFLADLVGNGIKCIMKKEKESGMKWTGVMKEEKERVDNRLSGS